MTDLDRYEHGARQRTYSKPGRRKLRKTPPAGFYATPNGWRMKLRLAAIERWRKRRRNRRRGDA